jgi:hypothetical protein
MLDFSHSLAFRKIDAASLWRGDTGFLHDDATTAADVVRYEQSRGCLNDLLPQLVEHLAAVSAAALLWVARTRQQAARYGPPSRVVIDDPHKVFVIGEDKRGGLFLYFDDNPTTTQTEQPTMKPPSEASTRDLALAAAWYVANSNQPTPSGDTAPASAWIVRDDPRQEKTDMSDRLPELGDDRRKDLATRIDQLQADAESIKRSDGTSAEAHYQGHREVFDMRQTELGEKSIYNADIADQLERVDPLNTGDIEDHRLVSASLANEREAQGHEYAGFLATRLAAYHEASNQPDLADPLYKEAAARKDIAEMLREGPEPERPTDPPPPRDGDRSATDAIKDMTAEPSGYGRYDALRESEAEARALSSQRQEQELAASKGERAPGDTAPAPSSSVEIEEEKKAAGTGQDAWMPELAHNIRPEIASTPQGTATVTTAKADAPQIEPENPDPQPMHPDDRRAMEAATPQHPDSHVSPAADPDPKAEEEQRVLQTSAADSIARQEGERRASAGEEPASPAAPTTAEERLAAREATYRAEREAAGPEAAQDHGVEFDGPTLSFGRD